MKICNKCKESKCLSEFWVGSYYCKDCDRQRRQDFYAKNPQARIRDRNKTKEWQKTHAVRTNSVYGRNSYLKQKYNITIEHYENILVSQDNKCAICQSPNPGRNKVYFSIDHDHTCCPQIARSCGKCIRGLLCIECNYMLGLCHDNIDVLMSAVEYLKRYNEER